MPFNHLPYNDAIGKKDSGRDIDQPRICQECGGIFKESDHEPTLSYMSFKSEFCPSCFKSEVFLGKYSDWEDDDEFWEHDEDEDECDDCEYDEF